MSKLKFFLLGIFFLISLSLYSQEESAESLQNEDAEAVEAFGIVRYSSGNNFSILRDGILEEHNVQDSDFSALKIREGDIVRTGENSFLEIQFLPSENIVKLAENTILGINKLNIDEGGQYELFYGRIRGEIFQSEESEPFNVRSRGVAINTRNSDFGFDFIPPVNRVVPRPLIYSFEGDVEISVITREGMQNRIINSNEELDIDSSLLNGTAEIINISEQSLSSGIVTYWEQHFIQSLPISFGYPNENITVADQFVGNRNTGLDLLNSLQLTPDITSQGEISVTPWRALGGIISILGTITGITGIIFNSADLMIDSEVSEPLGLGLIIGGGTTLGIGLIVILIDEITGGI